MMNAWGQVFSVEIMCVVIKPTEKGFVSSWPRTHKISELIRLIRVKFANKADDEEETSK
jgi:hypothetical protein